MSRNISFFLTTPQFLDGTKTVTRRFGWAMLKIGDVLNAVEKTQGIKRGEKIKVLGQIRVIDLRREPLNAVLTDLAYGHEEMVKEGFPPGHEYFDPAAFVKFFCRSHPYARPGSIVTRIEFERPQ